MIWEVEVLYADNISLHCKWLVEGEGSVDEIGSLYPGAGERRVLVPS